MSYTVQIKIHQTNIYRGYLVLYQEGADPVQGPTKDCLQYDILTGWNKTSFSQSEYFFQLEGIYSGFNPNKVWFPICDFLQCVGNPCLIN